MSITITPDSTRFDLMDALTREAYGIADPGAPLDTDSDAYRWRYLADELVQQMSDEEFRCAFDYLCRAHDVDTIELDSVAYTIMQALDCTPEAAAALREWVFNACSDSLASLRQLDADLSMCGAWYPDTDALAADDLIVSPDGELFEQPVDGGEPMQCEADVWYDVAWGYFVMWR